MVQIQHTGAVRILIVTGRNDESLLACADDLSAAGADVERAADVYSAMARLALGAPFARVLLDIRGLDEREMQFLALASRYFPKAQVTVPLLEGTPERVSAWGRSVPTVSIEALVREFQSRPTSPAEDAVQLDEASDRPQTEDAATPGAAPKPMPALSTDDGPPEPETEPSLHEAVRTRMATGQSAPVRRAPPPGSVQPKPPFTEPTTPIGDDRGSALSQAEVDALLGQNEAEGGPFDDRSGPVEAP